MNLTWLVIAAITGSLLLPANASAAIGVGVGTGKITVDQPLRAGGVYTLPMVTVFNTGTETATYRMYLTLNQTQKERKPDPAWFRFSPEEFTLKPKAAMRVTPRVTLPLGAQAGEYFGYLEARPAQTVRQGSASVGIAAATKLRFRVTYSNIFVASWLRMRDTFRSLQPWSSIVTASLVLAALYTVARKYVRIDIRRA